MGNKVSYYRKKQRLTQKQLANKVGITRPYLSDIENNKKKPGTPISIKIARELKSTVEEIFFADSVNHSEQIG